MSKVSVSSVVDVTTTCHSFPRLPDTLIDRTNILETVEDMFDGGASVVTLEGEQGIGKTVLLALFAQRHPHDSVALFLRPTSRLAYDPAFMRLDLCNQILWLLRG